MKVKHLIKILSKIDPELNVGVLHDDVVDLATEAGIFVGNMNIPKFQFGSEVKWHKEKHKYFIIGNPGNYFSLTNADYNTPIDIYNVYDDGSIEHLSEED